MNLLGRLAQSLTPVVRKLADDFGLQVTVYRAVESTNSLGETTRTYTADALLTQVSCIAGPKLKEAAASDLQNIGRERPYGLVPDQVGTIGFPRSSSSAVVSINLHDAMVVNSGPWSGYSFLATADGSPDAGGFLVVVPVTGAPAGLIL